MNPKISVIVPVYNTGLILRDTLESILNQTFTDFELILIDDGSTDVSADICDEYLKKDKRVRVVHQTNGGICAARNKGIELAKGEYITFCDHDDLYMPEKLQRQYDIAVSSGADIVNVGYIEKNEKGPTQVKALAVDCRQKDDIRQCFFDITSETIGTIWVKLYKSSFFNSGFCFDTKYTRGHEDINFNLKLLPLIKSYVSVEEVLYHHVKRESLSTSAGVHYAVIKGMVDEIENYSLAITSFNIDTKKEVKKYVERNAGMLRSLSVYMVKCNVDFKEYVHVLSSLKYIRCDISWISLLLKSQALLKDVFVLYLVEHRLYRLLFYVNKCHVFKQSFLKK